jgi:large subunit ribosomal protein L2
MAIKRYKPYTSSRRAMSVTDYSILTDKEPEKRLTKGISEKAGRNNYGRITMRRRGGGHKKLYRQIDFRRNKDGVPGKITALEYDPNRTAFIALVVYADGDKRYIIAPKGLQVGASVMSGEGAPFEVGNCLPLKNIPTGTMIHNLEMVPGKGGQVARSAGNACQLLAKEERFCVVRMPSGEMRRVLNNCRAVIGVVGNEDQANVKLGKAGRARWLGRRPKVRGVVMNPFDHPHGGGEGRTSGGRHPVSPWGTPAKGFKTRKKSHRTDRYIIRRRNA